MYDFDAGNLGLDFANTLDWHASNHPVERLTGWSDLVTWGGQAGLISPDQVASLHAHADKHLQSTRSAYEFAIQVREAIYHIFSNRYSGEPVAEADLATLNSVVREALAHRRLVPSGDEFHWEWTADVEGINRILWSVAFSAAELLTSAEGSRVRVCEDDRGCGFLFIDRTKNHSRRWCSMDSCGNRAKAHRHYSRLQAS
jgi:predicted RNA-binding Zn ribbon-like protein